MNSKLKAFTLFELVIGMLLSALVMGMIYLGCRILSEVSGNYLASSSRQSGLMQLGHTLQDDFDRAVSIQSGDGQVLLLDSLGSPRIIYLVAPDQLIRKSSVLDSFSAQGLQAELRFEHVPVQTGLVDELQVRFNFSGAQVLLIITKRYSSQQLINAQP